MALRVLIAPDKFKGTLSAHAAAEAIARGWSRARPKDRLELVPISDGGDGFGQVMSRLLGAVARTIKTCDAAHRPRHARWWWEPRTSTALIESAEVIGLASLPVGRFHPFELDTFGLGKVMLAAFQFGARRCLVGIGGSATNDGGFGLARALGWQFLDARGRPIEHWTQLPDAVRLGPPSLHRLFPQLIVAVDVQNPLLGPRGATRVYGPQKGIRPLEFRRAEACLSRLAHLLRQAKLGDPANLPGAGAAGGLGFGLAAFLGGILQPGFQLVAQAAKLERYLKRADLVVTGEGAIDGSTFMGKGAGCIARLCQEHGVPCVGLAGTLGPRLRYKQLFTQVRSLAELTTVSDAKRRPAKWLQALAKDLAKQFE